MRNGTQSYIRHFPCAEAMRQLTFLKKAQNMPWRDLEELAGQVKVGGCNANQGRAGQ